MRATARLLRMFRDRSGVAGIEMALLLPIMLLLFLGMTQGAALLSDNWKMTNAADLAADLVTRLESPTAPNDIADTFRAVNFAMAGAGTTDLRIEIHNYRKIPAGSTFVVQRIWSENNNAGTACVAPDTTGFDTLMTNDNDLVIAVICGTHTPDFATGPAGELLFGAGSFRLRHQIAMRPRGSLTLECPTCSN